MSTKKKDPVKTQEPAVKQEKKEAIKKPAPKKEKKQYEVGEITMTKFVFDEDFVMRRRVDTFLIKSDKDMSKDTEAKSRAMNETYEKLMNRDYCFSDYEAIEDALKEIAHLLAQGAVETEYGRGRICRGCTAMRLRNLANAMRRLRSVKLKRQSIYRKLDVKEVENGGMPEILPPVNEWDNWEVRNGKFVKKPTVETHVLKLSDAQKEKLEKTLEGFETANKGKKK
jgi:hypothetical protein